MARVPLIEEQVPATSLVLSVKTVGLSQEQFFRLCRDNPDLSMELSAQKEIIVMGLPGGNTSRRNAIITTKLTNWAERDGTGVTFDCACHFVLPNGAIRGPDASWVSRLRWDALPAEQREAAVPFCPEFVVELRFRSDRLPNLKKKMEEYIANGAQLGWLLDPFDNCAIVYKPGRPPQRIDHPTVLTGDPVLHGFQFDFREIL